MHVWLAFTSGSASNAQNSNIPRSFGYAARRSPERPRQQRLVIRRYKCYRPALTSRCLNA
eukprot:6206780-Pleurochrysis_carterae.AAC.1